MSATYIAIDFGGGSGRVIAATLNGYKLKQEEVYRFPNRMVQLGKHLYWDFPALFAEMMIGLQKVAEGGYNVQSIGIDTWGVDFGLIDKQGNLLGNPISYRDNRTCGLPEELFPNEEMLSAHYAETGTQVMNINTLYQLYSMKKSEDAILNYADKLLFMPDLFSYYLTGCANNEYSIASTSELINADTKQWNLPLIRRLGLPEHLFGEIVMPGTTRGFIKPEIAEATGLPTSTKVIAVASHDTASAIFAVPKTSEQEGYRAYLSSGTWSLLGVTTNKPILSEEARKAGFTNEGGIDGKICFLQNITGLWIMQQLMQQWTKRGEGTDYDTLTREAESASISSLIDVDDALFAQPDDMEKAIGNYCKSHNQAVPATRGEYARCVLQSLALRYKKGIDGLNNLLDKPIRSLQIIGGGSKNQLLNKLTREAIGIPVQTGPAEATAIGNILVQVLADGKIKEKNEIQLEN